MIISLLKKADACIEPLRGFAVCAVAPLFDLAARLFLAEAFWSSGVLRFKDWQNGNFDNQVFLFELEHPVPGLAAETAAYVTMAAELALPVLLAFGLFGRIGAAGLLLMTAVIELTYQHQDVHVLWAFLAAMIFIKGPGMISLDYLLLKYIRR